MATFVLFAFCLSTILLLIKALLLLRRILFLTVQAPPSSVNWESKSCATPSVRIKVAPGSQKRKPFSPPKKQVLNSESYHHGLRRLSPKDRSSLSPSLRYHAEDVAQKMIETFASYPDITTPNQSRAERRIAKLNAEMDSTWPAHKDMVSYMKAFDHFFFGGHLQCRTKLLVCECSMELNGMEAVGETELDLKKKSPSILITISRQHHLFADPEDRRREVLGTLLHEMAHGLFMLYSCDSMHSLDDRFRCEFVGRTGHGPTWKSLALLIQEKFAEVWPELQVSVDLDCLGIMTSCALEDDWEETQECRNDSIPHTPPDDAEDDELCTQLARSTL